MIQEVETRKSDTSLKEVATTTINLLSIYLVVKNETMIKEIIASKLMMLSDVRETQIIWTMFPEKGCRD